MRLIDKNVAYLIVQPATKLFASEDTVTLNSNREIITKKGFGGIPIFIPIPLISFFGGVQRFLGFQEVGHVKTNNIYTSTATNTINNLSATTTDIKLKSSNRSTTFATRGSGTFQLDIIVSVNNLLEMVFEAYMEFATRTLFNTRFHYLSNSTLAFNMLLSSYNKDRTQDMNSRYTLIFTRPEVGLTTLAGNENKPNDKFCKISRIT